MTEYNIPQLFFKWLVARYLLFLSAAGGCFLFIVLSWLSHIDTRPSIYAASLCLFAMFIWGIYDFFCFRYKSKQLADTLKFAQYTLQSLPNSSNLLEEQYQQLILELHQDRISQVSKTEKDKSEREDYYTLWVHQIKTPISALRLLLRSDDLPSNAFAMEQELFKIEQYAEMVLQYLRLESMSYDLLLQECALYELIKPAVRKYSYAFIGKRLSLTLEEFAFSVITDKKWMGFVLEQLLSNSVKYTNKGGVSIGMDPEHDRTLLIQDTGIGIKSEDLPRIFDRGFTGYNGRMDRTSTGIGLYLCKRVTERLGVKLSVSSKINQGTAYRIYFPPESDSIKS